MSETTWQVYVRWERTRQTYRVRWVSLSAKIETLQLRVNCKMRRNVSPKSWWKHFICRCTFRVRPYQYFYSTFKLKNRETKLTLNNSKTYLKTNPCLASVLKIVFQRSCVTAVVELEFFTSNLGLRKTDLYAGNTVYVSYRGNPRIPLIRYNSRIDIRKDFGKNYNIVLARRYHEATTNVA